MNGNAQYTMAGYAFSTMRHSAFLFVHPQFGSMATLRFCQMHIFHFCGFQHTFVRVFGTTSKTATCLTKNAAFVGFLMGTWVTKQLHSVPNACICMSQQETRPVWQKLLEIVMMLYAKSYPKVVKLEQRPPSHESWRTGTAPTTVPTPWIWWWRVVEIPVPFCGERPPKAWFGPKIIVQGIQKNSNVLRQLVVLSMRRTELMWWNQMKSEMCRKKTKKETGN